MQLLQIRIKCNAIGVWGESGQPTMVTQMEHKSGCHGIVHGISHVNESTPDAACQMKRGGKYHHELKAEQFERTVNHAKARFVHFFFKHRVGCYAPCWSRKHSTVLVARTVLVASIKCFTSIGFPNRFQMGSAFLFFNSTC